MSPVVQLQQISRNTEIDVEKVVRQRYSAASHTVEPSLCCPVEYDPQLLAVLPDEIVQRDYGCGDPSRFVRSGDVVLDLGCGGGKICYIAAQLVGPSGRVVGVDMNDEMLDLARRHQPEITNRLGYDNVTFRKGRIQDLALDLDAFEEYLRQHPVQSSQSWLEAQSEAELCRRQRPLVASGSIDIVLSNCVLNLVQPKARHQLFAEMQRVLRPGGRAVISDIVCDEPVPETLKQDPALWSGCISGAFVENDFLEAFAQAGFYGMEIVDRPVTPWATVQGIEFRSVTVQAFTRQEGPSLDEHHAVIYKGPWKSVTDDDGHILHRGKPMAVCAKRFDLYQNAPYAQQICPVPPRTAIHPSEARPFAAAAGALRDPRVTKGADFNVTDLPAGGCCGSGTC